MEKLEKVAGRHYTQNVGELPIEERVFFVEGLVAATNAYRIATEAEVAQWEEYKHKQEEEHQAMLGYAEDSNT